VSDFLKSNPQIDEAVRNSTNFEQMREAVLQTLAKQGAIVRDRTNPYDTRVNPNALPEEPAPVLTVPSQPVEPPTHMQVLYPGGNDRIEVYASSQKELDAKVAAINAAYGK